MKQNPFTVLSPKVRAWVYFVVFIVSLAAAAVQASGGDWLQAVGLLLGSLTSAMAGNNVHEE